MLPKPKTEADLLSAINNFDKHSVVTDSWAVALELMKVMAPLWRVKPEELSDVTAKLARDLAKEIQLDRAKAST